MKFEKPSAEVLRLFALVAQSADKTSGIEERKMFGYPCRFVNGNMFMGLHNNNLILRLSEKDREDIAKLGARPFEPMPKRIMKEYVVVPEEMLNPSNTVDLNKWISKSLAFASTLAPIQKKFKK